MTSASGLQLALLLAVTWKAAGLNVPLEGGRSVILTEIVLRHHLHYQTIV